uniref:Uncharacterized protein n=1 Tax=Oryza brachyantha TaxID=4533 RepID=J3KY48_ORYBR
MATKSPRTPGISISFSPTAQLSSIAGRESTAAPELNRVLSEASAASNSALLNKSATIGFWTLLRLQLSYLE